MIADEHTLLCLLKPRDFSESEIWYSIKFFWEYLFSDCRLMRRSEVVDKTWQPDLVAYNGPKDYWVIIELKGRPTGTSRTKTIEQVLDYAFRLHDKHPGAKVRLLIIGPWESTITEEAGYTIGFAKIEDIGEWLAGRATYLMKWFANAPCFPPGTLPYSAFEDMIEKMSARLPIVEEVTT